MARTRGEAEKFFGMRSAQPLEIEREIGPVKIFAGGIAGEWMCWQRRRGGFEGWNSLRVESSEPAVFTPSHLLNRCFAAKRAAAAVAQRTAAKINHIRFA